MVILISIWPTRCCHTRWEQAGTFAMTQPRHLLPGMLPNSRLRRASVHHKPCCWCKQLRHSEPPSSGNGENPPQVQVPRHQPRTHMANFLGAQSGDGNTCLHTTSAPTPESPLNVKATFRFPTLAQSHSSAFLHSDARSVRPQAAHTPQLTSSVSFLGVGGGGGSENPPPSYGSGNSSESMSG